MHVTICICTRDRGDSIVGTLRSIASLQYDDFDVVIIDQSTDDATALAVQSATRGDPRFTYIRSRTSGLSVARNTAVAQAQGPLIAFTDDDCEVPPQWLARINAYFHEDAKVGLISGAVVPGPHDPSLGFIPDYPISALRRIDSPWQKWRAGGIGANMAFRRDVLQAVGPFDEALSPGGVLYTYDDGDMTYRVLRAGYAVLNIPDATVVHHGFRAWSEGQIMMRHVGIAIGAACMKYLRLGDLVIVPTFVYEWVRCISWKRLFLLQKHSGVARFLAFGLGMAKSFQYPIDRRWRVYRLAQDEDRETTAVPARMADEATDLLPASHYRS